MDNPFILPKQDNPFILPRQENPFLLPRGSSPFGLTPSRKKTLDQKIMESETVAREIGVELPKEKKKFSLFDILEWARYPITNMLYEIAKQHKAHDLHWNDIDDILKAAVHGVTLKEKHNTEDILKMYFPKAPEWLLSIAGVAGDIITDPMTWLTFGMGGGVKGASKAAEAGEKYVAKAAKLAGKLSKKNPKLYNTFVKKMTEKYGGKTLSEAIQNAALKTAREAGKAGLYARVPFTKLETRLLPKMPSELLAGGMSKLGVAPKVTKAVEYLPNTLKKAPIVGDIYKAFSPTGRLGPYTEAHTKEIQRSAFGSYEIEKISNNFADITKKIDNVLYEPEVKKLVKGLNNKTKAENKVLEYIRDSLEQGKDIPEKLKPIADDVRNMFDKQWNELIKRGIVKKERYVKNYFPRYFENPNTGEIAILKYHKKGNLTPNFTKLRTFKTAEEAKRHGFVLKDIRDSFRIYFDQAVKATTFHDYINAVVKRFGTKIGEKEAVAPEFAKVGQKGFENYIVPKEIADAINEIGIYFEKPHEFIKAARFFNRIQNTWKKMATVWWPGFHMRNAFSNFWTYVVKDGIGPKQLKNMKTALKVFRHPNSNETVKIFNPVTKKYTKVKIKNLYEFFRRSSAHTGTFTAAELRNEAGKLLKLGNKITAPVEKAAAKALIPFGSEAGSQIENVFRMASMLNDFEKGLSITKAAERVGKYFINYSDMTPADRLVSKFIPFWAWTKNNMINQLSLMLEDPGKYSIYTTKALRAINWQEDKEQLKYMPDYLKESLYTPLGGLTVGGKPLLINPNLPFQDPSRTISLNPLKTAENFILGGLSPFAKLPFELATNVSLFTKRPIAKHPGDTTQAPLALQPIMAALPERAKEKLGIIQNDKGVYEAPAKVIYGLLNLVPLLKMGENLLPRENEHLNINRPYTALSRTTGVKLKPFDIEYYKKLAKQKYYQELQRKIKKRLGAVG